MTKTKRYKNHGIKIEDKLKRVISIEHSKTLQQREAHIVSAFDFRKSMRTGITND